MPIVNADAKQLEWRGIVELSRDKVALEEILNDVDFHRVNQERFKLPSRLIAKVFLFRWIYLGSAYAYSKDPDFSSIGGQSFWQKIIDSFNDKYEGIYNYHRACADEVYRTGSIVSPVTGRHYLFKQRERRGQLEYNLSEVVNYPVQGFGADLMALIRSMIYEQIILNGWQDVVLPILSVHDSVMYDCLPKLLTSGSVPWHNISMVIKDCFKNVGQEWKKVYGSELLVPHDCEVQVGINWKYLHKVY